MDGCRSEDEVADGATLTGSLSVLTRVWWDMRFAETHVMTNVPQP